MIILFSLMSSKTIFDFNHKSDLHDWNVVDDVVMGGNSSGIFNLDKDGFGVFEGDISLENNGGFSSVKYRFSRFTVKDYTKIRVKLKGDGKEYQLRIKSNSEDSHSYIAHFSTSGRWEEIEIPLKQMAPSFRGRKLNLPNFFSDYMEEVAFLIGNKSKEHFKLLIDRIELI